MSDQSPILGLPYLQASQAQKHVTHNEALQMLDVLVQPTVQSRTLTAAPALPAAGDRFIVASGATGSWLGQSGKIAVWDGSAWMFLTPKAGWQCHVAAEGVVLSFSGSAWLAPSEIGQSFAMLGINATPDPLNPLTVAGPASLLNHVGAGHQLKLNKAAATDTASLLFQTGYSGRAEMGIAGSDDFSIKVSAAGSSFATALLANRTSGQISLPAGALFPDGTAAAPAISFVGDTDTGLRHPAADQIGLVTAGTQRALLSSSAFQIDVALSGSAVQSSVTDTTSTKVMKVGAFGLGIGATAITDLTADRGPGLYSFAEATATGSPGTGSYSCYCLITRAGASGTWGYLAWRSVTAGTVAKAWIGTRAAGGTSIVWAEQYLPSSILGTVSQSGGIPTGAIIERGSNANGDYVRFADGTQICRGFFNLGSVLALGAGTFANPYRTALLNWTFPASFAAAPQCFLSPVPPAAASVDVLRRMAIATRASANTTVLYQIGVIRLGADTNADSYDMDAVAVGRWF